MYEARVINLKEGIIEVLTQVEVGEGDQWYLLRTAQK